MSAVLGANTTKLEAGAFGDNWVDKQYSGELNSFSDSYEASALATASTIQLSPTGLIPSGARIKSVVVYTDALGSGVTLSAGDSDDAARYFAATSASGVTKIESGLVDGFDYVIGTATADDELLLTTAGTATGTIKWEIKYAV
jgi:hypothetical protein